MNKDTHYRGSLHGLQFIQHLHISHSPFSVLVVDRNLRFQKKHSPKWKENNLLISRVIWILFDRGIILHYGRNALACAFWQGVFKFHVQTSGGVSDAWIGVSDVNNHGIMAWLDGSEPNFMNWDYFQNHFPGRKCGVISTNFNWKYKPCYGARGFVCKKPLRGQ